MSDHDDSSREIDLKAALEVYGTDAFEGQLIYELEMKVSQLPTETFCEQGGWPEELSIEVTEIEDREEAIRVSVSVSFDEVVPSSCHDHPRKNPVSGALEILIDKTDGLSKVMPIYYD